MKTINEDARALAILHAKAMTLQILCWVSVIMGFIPMHLNIHLKWTETKKKSTSQIIVSMFLGFGGGVLLCATFLHMLPEVVESVTFLAKSGKLPVTPLPLAEVCVCAGFFITYLLEMLVPPRMRYIKKIVDEDPETAKSEIIKKYDGVSEDFVKTVKGRAMEQRHYDHSHAYGHDDEKPKITSIHDVITCLLNEWLVVMVLSIYELFEGLAIGLEGSANGVWFMFAAVAARKFVVAFCIGVELVASKTDRYLSVAYIFLFSITSPAGIWIGLLICGDFPAAHEPFPVILQCVATGTLVYVAFFQIFQHHRNGRLQYFAIILGFIFMCGLQLAFLQNHTHGAVTDAVTNAIGSSTVAPKIHSGHALNEIPIKTTGSRYCVFFDILYQIALHQYLAKIVGFF